MVAKKLMVAKRKIFHPQNKGIAALAVTFSTGFEKIPCYSFHGLRSTLGIALLEQPTRTFLKNKLYLLKNINQIKIELYKLETGESTVLSVTT